MSKEEIIEVEEIEQVEEDKVRKGFYITKDWLLSSDPLNLVLEQYGYKVNPREKDLSKQRTYGLIKKTWHSNLQQVFNQIIDRSTYAMDFGDLKQVHKEIVELKNMVKEFKKISKLNKDTLSIISNIK